MLSARRCGCATSESRRSATHFAPGRLLHRGADEVDRVRRRGREDDVDPLAARDPDRGRDRGQVPAHVLVRDEQRAARRAAPARARARAPPCRAAPRPACGPSGRCSGRGAPTPASAAAGRRPVDPLRVVRREHVRLDPERGQVLRELERPLDAAAAGGREVERDEQHLHAADATAGDRACSARRGTRLASGGRERRSGRGRRRASRRRSAAGSRGRRSRRSDRRRRGARTAGSSSCRRRGRAARRRCRRARRRRSGSSSRGRRRRRRRAGRARAAPATRPGVSGLAARASDGLQFAAACTATGSTNSAAAQAASSGRSSGALCFRNTSPTTSAATPAADRDPGHEGRAALLEPVVEVARVGELQRDPADERRGQDEPAQQRAQHGEAAGERERERQEAGGAARLRERDEVGEGDEERAARASPRATASEPPSTYAAQRLPQREAGERDEEERRDGDRTGAAEHLGREPVARVREDVELARRTARTRAAAPRAPGSCERGVADDREQPDEVRRRRDDERGERGRDPPRLARARPASGRRGSRRTGARGRSRRSGGRPRARARRRRRTRAAARPAVAT